MLDVFLAKIHGAIHVATPGLIYDVMLFRTFFWRLLCALYGMLFWTLLRMLFGMLNCDANWDTNWVTNWNVNWDANYHPK